MESSRSTGSYRCLFSDSVVSAACDPGDVVSHCLAAIKHGTVEGQFANCGPQLELIAVTVAFVTVVSPGAQVDRKDPAPRGC